MAVGAGACGPHTTPLLAMMYPPTRPAAPPPRRANAHHAYDLTRGANEGQRRMYRGAGGSGCGGDVWVGGWVGGGCGWVGVGGRGVGGWVGGTGGAFPYCSWSVPKTSSSNARQDEMGSSQAPSRARERHAPPSPSQPLFSTSKRLSISTGGWERGGGGGAHAHTAQSSPPVTGNPLQRHATRRYCGGPRD